jgi:hypothetical protein
VIRATWNGAVLAEADKTVVVEGNHYFPPETVDFSRLRLTQVRSRDAARRRHTVVWIKSAVTYMVPFAVSNAGVLVASRAEEHDLS